MRDDEGEEERVTVLLDDLLNKLLEVDEGLETGLCSGSSLSVPGSEGRRPNTVEALLLLCLLASPFLDDSSSPAPDASRRRIDLFQPNLECYQQENTNIKKKKKNNKVKKRNEREEARVGITITYKHQEPQGKLRESTSNTFVDFLFLAQHRL